MTNRMARKPAPRVSTSPPASIAIKRGNRVGKPYAVYAADGAGNLARTDYATGREARAAARTLASAMGWPMTDDTMPRRR